MTHPETGEFYIGRRTSEIQPELDSSYRGSSQKWYSSLNDDIINNVLVKEILDVDIHSDEELNVLETEYITKNIKNPLCMNAYIPGKGFHGSGPLSDTTKNKISEFNKGRRWITNGIESKTISKEESLSIPEGWYFGRTKFSEETKLKMSNNRKGKVQTPEHIKKRVNQLKGKSISEDHKKKISESLKGREFSNEHKIKLSESGKNRKPISEETRKKLSNSMSKRILSEDHKKNISESKKGKSKTKKNSSENL
jgi:hypothetical protein